MNQKEETIRVNLAERSYDILLGEHLLAKAAAFVGPLLRAKDVFVAYDENVYEPHAEQLIRELEQAGCNVSQLELAAGEPTKCVEQLVRLWNALSEKRFGRDCAVVAVGGGVAGDLVGFAAATYLRGVDFFQVPTSLLAMVDSSVGGKTGINNNYGKNLLGAFWQPKLVLNDIATLRTLPDAERIAALAEIIKYGVIYDAPFFEWLEQNIYNLRELDPDAIMYAVKRSCEIKAAVVSADERESGLREILNFGHTVGHAIENAAGYGTLRHGEAIAIGMVAESLIGLEHESTWPMEDHHRLVDLITAAGLPVSIPDGSGVELQSVLAAARSDKKVRSGTIRCVLPRRLGSVESVRLEPATIEIAARAVGAR